jgi:hypothetical protein
MLHGSTLAGAGRAAAAIVCEGGASRSTPGRATIIILGFTILFKGGRRVEGPGLQPWPLLQTPCKCSPTTYWTGSWRTP